MLPDLKRDDDGGVTLYIQHDTPGADREANWLPEPSGPFFMVMRLYWPKPEAPDGQWKAEQRKCHEGQVPAACVAGMLALESGAFARSSDSVVPVTPDNPSCGERSLLRKHRQGRRLRQIQTRPRIGNRRS
jgi:hypothetical protein